MAENSNQRVSGAEPLLSVGLPVYNGEKYLRESIDSILGQTFSNFELIISDNASTDGTEEICRTYVSRDSRVRYYRNPVNIGGANNANRTFALARGQYFRWAAYDDVCAAALFERCIAILERDPTIVLCYSQTVHIDSDGKEIGQGSSGRGTESKTHERFRSLSSRYHWCEQSYGVMRSEILRATGPQKNYTDSDRTLLCGLALRGPFVELQERLFYKRLHSENQYTDWSGRMAWYYPGRGDAPVFPRIIQFFDYWRTIGRAPLRLGDRTRCYWVMLEWPLVNIRPLAKELIVAGFSTLRWVKRSGERRIGWIKDLFWS